jgi:hypothetical protein
VTLRWWRQDDLDPGRGGNLPAERAHRKRAQIEAIVRLVRALLPITTAGGTVVDFCGGSGHLALVLGATLPHLRFVVVDFNANALRIADERAARLGLTNVTTVCGDVASYAPPADFALGLALHACGAATDLAMQCCTAGDAAFVVSPCCVGKVGKTGRATLSLPRSRLFAEVLDEPGYLQLAAAADFHSEGRPSPRRKAAKAFIELDRAAAMAERGYRVRLGRYPIVTPVKGASKNRTQIQIIHRFYLFPAPSLTGVTIGYCPRSASGVSRRRRARRRTTLSGAGLAIGGRVI